MKLDYTLRRYKKKSISEVFVTAAQTLCVDLDCLLLSHVLKSEVAQSTTNEEDGVKTNADTGAIGVGSGGGGRSGSGGLGSWVTGLECWNDKVSKVISRK